MLDHDDGVAEIAQLVKRGEQPLIVALVQTDARFVEDVEDAGELGADLRSEADALRLAAGKRAAFAIEREVAEAHLVEKTEAQQDFPPDLAADLFLGLAQRPLVQPALRGGDGEVAELRKVKTRAGRPADGDGEHLRPQARPVAGAAGHAGHVLRETMARQLAFAVRIEARDLRDQTLERALGGDFLAAAQAGEGDLLRAGAVEKRALESVAGFLERTCHRFVEGGGERLELVEVELGQRGRTATPRADRHVLQFYRVVRDEQRRIEHRLRAEAVADRTGAERAVEREVARGDLGVAIAGFGIEGLVAERDFLGHGRGRPEENGDNPTTRLERQLNGIGQARLDGVADFKAVDDGLDDVGARFLQARRLLEFDQAAVDARADETLAAELFDHIAELALLPLHDGGENLDGRAFLRGEHAVDHLLHRPAPQRLARDRMMGLAQMGEEQAQEIVDLRGGGDGGARIASGGALLDGDGGREALDEINLGLFHLLEELARVGGKAFDVAALALGVERVEGERGLARPADARHHDELVAREGERDVLEIMLASPADPDFLHRHKRPS